MHDFRRKTPHARQAMDGFLNAPQRSQPTGRHGVGSIDRFHGQGRHVGDFKRVEGYHPAPQAPVTGQQPPRPAAPQLSAKAVREQTNASILNMTLPGGFADRKEGKKTKEKGKHRRQRSVFRRWGVRAALVFGGLVLIVGGFLGFQIYHKLTKVFKGGGTAVALQAEVKPELLKGEGDGRINILLLGRGGDNHEGPDLTDTILVASVDPLNKSVNLVSVPRDLWVTPPGGSSSSKINAVYANAKYRALSKDSKNAQKAEEAGVQAIEQVVTQVLGIPLHYYGIVDFEAFKEAVDTVGGVTINVPEDLVDYSMAWENKGNGVLAKKGMQTFDGLHALMYVRSRHGSARGDFDRTERQRLFIQALSQKVLSAGTYTNPIKITQLMNTFGNHVSTDFSINDMLRLMTILKGADLTKMASIGLADPPNNYVRTDAVGNQSVVRPTAGIGNYSEIQAYIRNTLRDPYLAKENASLHVLNGTGTPGLASDKAVELQSYGYTVATVGDAPTQEYAKTVLVDLTGGKKPFTKNYLEKRLATKAVTKLPDVTIQAQGADFVIILGDE